MKVEQPVEAVKPDPMAIFDKPKIEMAERPLVRNVKSSQAPSDRISIKDYVDEKVKEQIELAEDGTPVRSNMPKEDFSLDQFFTEWKRMAEVFNGRDMKSLYNTMIAHQPELSGNMVKLKISNNIQDAEIDLHRMEILEHLRSKLNNYSIQLETDIVANDAGNIGLYTDREKYAAMIEKNPTLEGLRKRLSLDLQF